MPIQVVTAADRDAWMPLWQGYQTFYGNDIPSDVSAQTWLRLLDDSEPMWGALAMVDGVARGLVHWIFHRSTWSAGHSCYLQDLFVEPAARGRGTGRQLITHVTEAARAAGCARVYWMTQKTNTDAMALYDQVATQTDFVQYRIML